MKELAITKRKNVFNCIQMMCTYNQMHMYRWANPPQQVIALVNMTS